MIVALFRRIVLAPAVMALPGKKKVQAATPPIPEQAVASTKEDVAWVKTKAKSARQ